MKEEKWDIVLHNAHDSATAKWAPSAVKVKLRVSPQLRPKSVAAFGLRSLERCVI